MDGYSARDFDSRLAHFVRELRHVVRAGQGLFDALGRDAGGCRRRLH